MSHVVSSSAPITSAHTVKQYAGFGILGADIPATGDSGGSPVLNDSIISTSEYHWRVETPPSAGVLTIYPDLTFEWDGAGVADGSYPWVYRLFDQGVDAGTATVNQTVGALTLAIAKATHGHAADSLTLSTAGSTSLAIAEATHAHAADNLLLTTQWLLSIADALHTHAADNLDLDTSNAVWLTLQDATHGHAAEGVVLTLSNWLAIAESQHGHQADTVHLDPGQIALAIAEAVHAHLAENLTLSVVYPGVFTRAPAGSGPHLRRATGSRQGSQNTCRPTDLGSTYPTIN